MTLQQLEYIVAIDRYRQFVKAADACGVTQSTLSTMIRKLEDELNVVIFDRNNHSVVPTQAGEIIIQQAKTVLYQSQRLVELSQKEQNRVQGSIRLGCVGSISTYLTAKLYVQFKEHPYVSLNVFEEPHNMLISKLHHGELDMAIMSLPQEEKGILEVPLYHEKVWIYVSPQDSLFQKDSIDVSELTANNLWTVYPELACKHDICNLGMQELLQSVLNKYYTQRPENNYNNFSSGSIYTLLDIVDEYGGYTFVPELFISHLSENRCQQIRPLKEGFPKRVVSLYMREDYPYKELVKAILKAIKQIIPDYMLDEQLKNATI